MNGSSLSTKLLVALAAKRCLASCFLFTSLKRSFPTSSWRATAHCRLLCSATRNHCAARDVTAFSCSIAQSASLHLGIDHRSVACLSSRRAISGAAAPHVARGEDVGWPDAFSLWVPLPLCSSPSRLLPSFITTSPLHAIPAMPNQGLQPTRLRRAVAMTDSNL